MIHTYELKDSYRFGDTFLKKKTEETKFAKRAYLWRSSLSKWDQSGCLDYFQKQNCVAKFVIHTLLWWDDFQLSHFLNPAEPPPFPLTQPCWHIKVFNWVRYCRFFYYFRRENIIFSTESQNFYLIIFFTKLNCKKNLKKTHRKTAKSIFCLSAKNL